MELWRIIRNHSNYEVSSEGRVRNRNTGKILKPRNNKKYARVNIDGKDKYVHRLVAENFYEIESDDYDNYDVIHRDGDHSKNFLWNLKFCTRKETIQHSYETNRSRNNYRIRIVETGEEFLSVRECARKINGQRTCILRCLHGEQSTYMGYHFEFVE